MLYSIPGKTLHGESLPALTDSLDDERLPGRVLFPVLKDGFNLTFEHITLFRASFCCEATFFGATFKAYSTLFHFFHFYVYRARKVFYFQSV